MTYRKFDDYFRDIHWSNMIEALRRQFHQNNKDADPNSIVIRPGIELVIHPDSRIPFEFFCFRNVECTLELEAFIELSLHAKNFMDIGALHGIFSLTFTSLGGDRKALAIEPSPVAFAKLYDNILKNKANNIKPMECAVSDRSGQLKMHYKWEHLVAAGDIDSENIIHVPKMTGDEICVQEGFIPDIIKIDVEGHEVKVINGLYNILRDHKPIVMIELHHSMMKKNGENVIDILDAFDALGYHAKSLDGTDYFLANHSPIEDIERVVFTYDTIFGIW